MSVTIRSQTEQYDAGEGVDIRNPSSAFLGISSIDRYANLAEKNAGALVGVVDKSPYNMTITRAQPMLAGFFTRIAVTEFMLRWYMPTVTGNNNRIKLRYRVGGVAPGVEYTITLPSTGISTGATWYNPTTLAAALQTLIRTASGNVGFTLVADLNTGIFTAQSNNADTFSFGPIVDNSFPNRTTLFEMMNWGGVESSPIFASTTYSGVPSMIRTQFIDVVCNQLTANQSVKDADSGIISRDVLCRIYLAEEGITNNPAFNLGTQPFVIHRQFSDPKQIRWLNNMNIGGVLTFELYDDQGYPLESGNGTFIDGRRQGDWNMSLLVSEV